MTFMSTLFVIGLTKTCLNSTYYLNFCDFDVYLFATFDSEHINETTTTISVLF